MLIGLNHWTSRLINLRLADSIKKWGRVSEENYSLNGLPVLLDGSTPPLPPILLSDGIHLLFKKKIM